MKHFLLISMILLCSCTPLQVTPSKSEADFQELKTEDSKADKSKFKIIWRQSNGRANANVPNGTEIQE